jgi:NMD protein affecting ribosome stability and mRNA decay
MKRGYGKIEGKAKCPDCGAGADGYTETILPGEVPVDAKPETGNVAICAYCGAINLYEVKPEAVSLRRPTEAELEDILKSVPEINAMVSAVKALRARYLRENN